MKAPSSTRHDDLDEPVGGLQARAAPGQVAAGPRGHEHLGVPGLQRRDARDRAVHPVGDGAERVVVEAGHLAGVDACRPAASSPTAPRSSSRPCVTGYSHDGHSRCSSSGVGLVEVTGARSARRRRTACRRSRSRCGSPLSATSSASRAARHRDAGLLVEQAEDDRQRVDRLRSRSGSCRRRRRSARRTRLRTRRRARRNCRRRPAWPSSSAVSADDRTRPVAGRRSRPRRGRPWRRAGWSGGASGRASRRTGSLSHSPVGDSSRLHAPHVRDHRVVLPLEHLAVAVRLPQRPRHPHRRVAPDRGGVRRGEVGRRRLRLQHVRHDEGHQPVGGRCSSGEVGQPVSRKAATSKR